MYLWKYEAKSLFKISDTGYKYKKPKTPILLEFSHKFVFNCVKQTNKHINQTRYITSLVEVISLFSLMNSYGDLKYVCYCLVSLEYLTQEANTTGFRSKMIYFSYKEKLIIFACAFQDLYFTILSLTVVNYRSTRY